MGSCSKILEVKKHYYEYYVFVSSFYPLQCSAPLPAPPSWPPRPVRRARARRCSCIRYELAWSNRAAVACAPPPSPRASAPIHRQPGQEEKSGASRRAAAAQAAGAGRVALYGTHARLLGGLPSGAGPVWDLWCRESPWDAIVAWDAVLAAGRMHAG